MTGSGHFDDLSYIPKGLRERQEAIEKIGGKDIWYAWLRGEVTVTVSNTQAQNQNSAIFTYGKDHFFCKPWLRHGIEYERRIIKLKEHTGFDVNITGAEFKEKSERLRNYLMQINQKEIYDFVWENMFKDYCLPVILPQTDMGDVGKTVSCFIDGLLKSYTETFNNQKKFKDEENIIERLRVAFGFLDSRREKLLKRMEKSPVIGFYFPNILRGYSLRGARRFLKKLPHNFILPGLEMLSGGIMWPEYVFERCGCGNLVNFNLENFEYQSFKGLCFPLEICFKGDEVCLVAEKEAFSSKIDYFGGLFFYL